MCQREKDVVDAMVGNGEQVRMWGGWKGLPLPASYWPGMTAFSPEAPSSLLHPSCSPLHFHCSSLQLCSPPSLSCLAVAIHITTGAKAIVLAIWAWRRKALCFCAFKIFFPLHLYLAWIPAWSFISPSVPISHSSLPHTPVPPPFPSPHLCPLPRPLQRSRPCYLLALSC